MRAARMDEAHVMRIIPRMKTVAVLRISCLDRPGIVATVTDLIFKQKGNILHADEHLDQEKGLFLMRIEFDPNGSALAREKFAHNFTPIAEKFSMSWTIKYSDQKPRVAILLSKELHCLADLLARYQAGELNCELALIASNHTDAKKLADFHGIEFHQLETDKKEAEARLRELFEKNEIDLIVLARYMQILSDKFVEAYPNKIINIHHSFLPAFVGAKPYHQAHERGVKIIGVTSHYVTAELDTGPIIEQDVVRISHRETVSDIIQKGRDLEKVVLSRAVKWHLANKILVYGNKTVVFN